MIGQTMDATRFGPVSLVLASALMWGLWWVPVRLCEALGLTGVWPNLAINLGALLGLAALVLLGRPTHALSMPALLGSILIGIAVALYGAALSLTEVARAVLLFYLAPAWSTLIEVTFIGRRWHAYRLPPLVLSLLGMIMVMRGDIALDGGNIGDLAALGSGLAWSAGAALIFTTENQNVPRLSLAVIIASVATSVILLPLGWQGFPRFDLTDTGLALLLALSVGMLCLAPIIGITLWGAGRLAPSTISFLLAAEILSGITSSAFFLDEPFGWWEVSGTTLIVASIIAHITLGADPDER